MFLVTFFVSVYYRHYSYNFHILLIVRVQQFMIVCATKTVQTMMNIHDQRITVTMVLAPIQLSMWHMSSGESGVVRLAVVPYTGDAFSYSRQW